MSKLSLKKREEKRELLVAKYRDKYTKLKSDLDTCYANLLDPKANVETIIGQIEALQADLESIPRNGLRHRLRNRCQLTGRPRGVYRRFKLARGMLRKYAMMGMIPGLRKASW